MYANMDIAHQKVIDSEQMLGKLSLGPSDEHKTLKFQNHNEIVEKMLRIVAEDSSTDTAK